MRPITADDSYITQILERVSEPDLDVSYLNYIFREACKDDAVPLEVIKKIFKLNKTKIDLNKSSNYQTPLFAACERKKPDCVEWLLSKGANVKNTNQFGENILHKAIQEGHGVIINKLLASGFDIQAPTQKGVTALMLAVEKGQRLTIRKLLENGANIDATNKDGKTALMFAVIHSNSHQNKDESCMDILLEYKVNPLLKNRKGHTAYEIGLMDPSWKGSKAEQKLNQYFKVWNTVEEKNVILKDISAKSLKTSPNQKRTHKL